MSDQSKPIDFSSIRARKLAQQKAAKTDETIDQRVRDICAEGYNEYDAGHYRAALRLFYQAWLELPKPQPDWKQSTWVLSSIGDCYFRLGLFEQGREALTSALHCPKGSDSGFIHLRLGQCLYELQQHSDAREHLCRARELGGEQIFAKEDSKFRLAAKHG